MKKQTSEVKSSVYASKYYTNAFEGKLDNFIESLKSPQMGNRFEEVFRRADLKEGESVLDVGCGRGELVYYSLLKGASRAQGIDYSQDALDIAQVALNELPPDLKNKGSLKCANVTDLKLDAEFDCCFLTDIVEHLTDTQLKKLFSEIKEHLTDKGRIIIHTAPNVNWLRFEYPLKRFFNIPSTLIKRLSGRKPYKPTQEKGIFKKIAAYLDLIYIRDYYNYSLEMHINEQTPASLKRHLDSAGLSSRIWCEDGSSNLISIICKKFWGPDIWAVARRIKKTSL
jgi:2-polyprenyl-3-methyl-5-hydroxy-6-metoxy-1,4-benzoquinol methylase